MLGPMNMNPGDFIEGEFTVNTVGTPERRLLPAGAPQTFGGRTAAMWSRIKGKFAPTELGPLSKRQRRLMNGGNLMKGDRDVIHFNTKAGESMFLRTTVAGKGKFRGGVIAARSGKNLPFLEFGGLSRDSGVMMKGRGVYPTKNWYMPERMFGTSKNFAKRASTGLVRVGRVPMGAALGAGGLEVIFGAHGVMSEFAEPGEEGAWIPGVAGTGAGSVAGLATVATSSMTLAVGAPLIAGIGGLLVGMGAYKLSQRGIRSLEERMNPAARTHAQLHTAGASTMRQMAIQAMQNSPYNTRQLFGREAEILHG